MDKFILSSTDILPFYLFSKNKQLRQPMKKGAGIGVGIVIVVVAILFGIDSLPDEVLLESPSSIETSEGQTGEEKKLAVPSESITSAEQTGSEEDVGPPDEQVEQTEPDEPETDGEVIEIKIKDGVGSGDR